MICDNHLPSQMEESREEAKSSSLMTIVTNTMNSMNESHDSIRQATEYQKQPDLGRSNRPNNENDPNSKIFYNIKMLTSKKNSHQITDMIQEALGVRANPVESWNRLVRYLEDFKIGEEGPGKGLMFYHLS